MWSMKGGSTPRQILSEELEELRKVIIAHHLSAGQKASGRTMASLRVDVSEESGTLWGRNAFGVLETGRRGGKVPMGFQAIIRQWMKDKGIKATPIPYKTDRPHKYTPEQRGEMSLSFLIARKIKREGTRLFRTGGRDDIYSNAIPEAVRRVGDRMLQLVGVEVDSIKINKTINV